MKFLADPSLGRLSRWLRMLGCDTVYWRGEADRSFLRASEKEGRAVLTRRRDIPARQHPGIVLFVESDRVEDQITEVLRKLNVKPDPDAFFSICLECNVRLIEMTRDEVRPEIPDYVYRTQRAFRRCPQCGRTYWPGTHRVRAMAMLRRILKAGQDDGRMT
ncbi:MAG: Mut7-C RNAse domain-containing protein [Deltaproteobacteria bacterium]|nr:Mut7-C RNAse domain-containing protein [Deltaproteobacteria bacterium]